jgi:hypothetical protein
VSSKASTAAPNHSGKTGSGEIATKVYTKDQCALLYHASLQKFLTYSIIAAATFVGYVPLALEAHGMAGNKAAELFLQLSVILLTGIIGAAVAAAARQYYLISKLESYERLDLRDLERQLTSGATPLIQNLTQSTHGINWSATNPRRLNVLTAVVLLICVTLLLTLLFALL